MGDKSAFLAAARERNDLDIVVNVSRNSSSVQAAQLDNLVAANCAFYVIAAHDYRDMCRNLSRYPGIRVIAYDRPLPCGPAELFVSYNSMQVGKIQGEFLASAVPAGNYVFLKGPVSDGNSRDYFAGARKALAPLIERGSVRVVAEYEVRDWSPARAQAYILEAWNKNKGKLAAVLAPNDAIAEGVVETLKGLGADGRVFVTGQDAEPEALARIAQNTQAMTVRKSIPNLVATTLNAIAKMATGVAPESQTQFSFEGHAIPAILLEPELVTKNSLKNFR